MEGVTGSSPVPPRPDRDRGGPPREVSRETGGWGFHVAHKGLLLGADVGTSGLKALLLTPGGRLVASVTESYPLSIPRPGWAEQDPARWWAAFGRATRRLLAASRTPASAIAGVGLTGQMHGSVFLDAAGRVLSPALLWCDQRTSAECAEITRRVGGPAALLRYTMNPALTGFTAPKILWIRRHLPHVYRKIAKVLLPKDFVRFRLTGGFATDVSDASGTLLLDVRGRRWSQPVLKALAIPAAWMPPVFEGCEITGRVSADGARATGLLAGTPVVAGGGDQAAGAIGCGVIGPGVVSASLGTSGVVFAACDLPRRLPDGRLHLFCSAVKGGWHLMGVMLSAGGALRWFRDAFGAAALVPRGWKGDPYDAIHRAASRITPGAEGLTFLPYLTGERTPHADPHARGVFFGLSLRHGAAEMARAVLEGVTFGMRDSVELIRGMGVRVEQIRLSGGGAKNPHWCRLQATIYGATGVRLTREEGPALGAAMLAGIGTGVYADYPAATRACIAIRDRFTPVVRDRAELERAYRRYRDLYPAVRAQFTAAD